MNLRHWNQRVESLDRGEIEELQWERLRSMLAHVAATNPFYRSHWGRSATEIARFKTLADFRAAIPPVTKADFINDQEAAPPFGTRMTISKVQQGQIYLTSGTSGQGQEAHVASRLDLEGSARAFSYQLHWAGIQPGDRIAVTLPIGMQSGGLATRRACESYGLSSMFIGRYDAITKLEILKRFDPQAIIATPSYLTRLQAVAAESGIDPKKHFPSLQTIFLCAEPYALEWVVGVEAFWGARASEWYGCSQAGEGHLIACEQGVHIDGTSRAMLHNLEHRVLVEVLSPESGEPVRAGEEGELVVTNLHRSLPVVRFRTNDRARFLAWNHCACGRQFNGIQAGTVARYDDMIKLRGVNVWPDAVESVLFSDPRVVDYRARIYIDEEGREQVLLSVEISEGLGGVPADFETTMQDRIRGGIGLRFDIEMIERGTTDSAFFKARRWTDERQLGRRKIIERIRS